MKFIVPNSTGKFCRQTQLKRNATQTLLLGKMRGIEIKLVYSITFTIIFIILFHQRTCSSIVSVQ